VIVWLARAGLAEAEVEAEVEVEDDAEGEPGAAGLVVAVLAVVVPAVHAAIDRMAAHAVRAAAAERYLCIFSFEASE
jgi:hypothetical protein